MKSEPPARLVRALGPFTAMAVVVGTVIGSGIFVKPREVAENVPQFGLAATVWVLGGLLAFLGALALAEVAVLYPQAGGNYVFLREGYGRLAGFLWGWVEFWIIKGGSLAALATVFAGSLHDVLRNPALRARLGLDPSGDPLDFWGQRWLTVGVILVLALINVRGVRWGGLLQLFITSVKVGSLLAILALPFAVVWFGGPEPQPGHLRPAWPTYEADVRWSGFGTALLGVLFAYHGWMNVTPVAEEIRRPQRNLPLALLGGTAVIIFLYLGANLAYYLVLPQAEIAGCKDRWVATLFSERLLGPVGAAVASAAVMCSTFGALNGNLLVSPRLLYAMGEDGLAPRCLGAVHPRFHTPAVAILIMAAWPALLILAVALAIDQKWLDPEVGPFDILTAFAMFGSVTFETMAVATIFVFRRRCPDAERPYRCWGYPLVPLLYIGIMALVLVNMFGEKTKESLVGVGFIAVGAVVYYAWTFSDASQKHRSAQRF